MNRLVLCCLCSAATVAAIASPQPSNQQTFQRGSVAAAQPAAGPNQLRVCGHIPSALSHLQPLARLPATNRLCLTLGLPLRNCEALTSLLDQLYAPTSPEYHHYLTPNEFLTRFGPTEQDYQTVIEFARRNGLSVRGTHANRMLLDVVGSVADVERALHVTMRTYAHPGEKRTFYSADAEPAIEPGVPILDIDGLDDFLPPRRAGANPLNAKSALGPTPALATGPDNLYTAADLRKAYAPGVTNTGAGQVVALLEFDGYDSNSVARYEATNGLPAVPLNNVLVDGVTGIPSSDTNSVREVTMDIELVIAMAPGISQVMVYAGPSAAGGGLAYVYANDVLNRIATDNSAKQISSSWIWGGGRNLVTDQIFLQFAAQGQSYFNAAGDWGAYGSPWGNMLGANDAPVATSSYVTSVGGTTLTTGPTGAWVSEKVWNWGNGNASCGAISTTYPIPSWQQGLDLSASGGSQTMRNIPDVSMAADGIYIINGDESNYGAGTSAAAPLWAAFTALVNQQAADNDQPPVGFLNPAIYAIGKSSAYNFCFHDVTSGNNTNSFSPTAFFAAPGYDLCTGWGSPAGQNLINTLAPGALRILPESGFDASGMVGGPFNITAQDLLLTNSGTSPLTWALASSASWLTVSTTTGTLQPGQPAVTVSASLSPSASQLGAGVYSAAIWFTNLNSGIWQARFYTLSITSAPNEYAKAVLALNPVGYWQLNETSPPPPLNLMTNLGSLGTAALGSSTAGVRQGEPGKVGTSFRFSNPQLGVTFFGSHVDVPFQPALNPTGPFSVELWTKAAQITPDLMCPAAALDASQNGGQSRIGWIFY